MEQLRVTLLGRMTLCLGEYDNLLSDQQKAQELFCYLLLHRNKPHAREQLASLLWSQCTTTQSMAYLRRALWKLQQALESVPHAVIKVDTGWLQIDPDCSLWLDVKILEDAFDHVKELEGWNLDTEQVKLIKDVVNLYKGELLEGWYHDWCLYERQHLQHLYLILLDKLMEYFEVHGKYESGLEYGKRILRIDRAREITHRRLMRLYYLAGDRTGALRQFEACVDALKEELDVPPSNRTYMLKESVSRDQAITGLQTNSIDKQGDADRMPVESLSRMRDLRNLLDWVQRQIKHEIEVIESKFINN